MRLRFSTNFNRCCLDTFRANEDEWKAGATIICRGCEKTYVLTRDGYWRAETSDQEKGAE